MPDILVSRSPNHTQIQIKPFLKSQIPQNIQRIEANKDRQEAAILLFTVVTIIFLPLSFMSSLFGMNTSDIRNMGKNQWIFWATAIPVTFLVVGLAVIAVLHIDSVRELWARIVERDRKQRVVQYDDSYEM